ncbi:MULTISPECIES: hypothetical protein [Flavobacterium]|uniref:hypothetical protein n=1 Tax=Flavobacterium TaxID=237 RepID=UPI00188B3792|nr:MULTISPECIES: hypothetical protein [Flavobacterium]MBF4472950.1 hypothetical protein [Flavobacterium sp. HJJ]
MKNTLKKIIFLAIGLSLIACSSERNVPFYFNFKNNTGKLIYWGMSYSYPDTSLKNIENVPSKNTAYKIYPGKTEAFSTSILSFNATAQIFIFDSDVIEKTPWDSIVKYNIVLKRYQFTQSELEKMNWEIIYDAN